jgi:hypothetical protein
MGKLLQSWAEVVRFPIKELAGFGKFATLWEISHGLGGSAAKVLWTMKTRAGTFLTAPT